MVTANIAKSDYGSDTSFLPDITTCCIRMKYILGLFCLIIVYSEWNPDLACVRSVIIWIQWLLMHLNICFRLEPLVWYWWESSVFTACICWCKQVIVFANSQYILSLLLAWTGGTNILLSGMQQDWSGKAWLRRGSCRSVPIERRRQTSTNSKVDNYFNSHVLHLDSYLL